MNKHIINKLQMIEKELSSSLGRDIKIDIQSDAHDKMLVIFI